MGFRLVSLPRLLPLRQQTHTRHIFGLTRAGGDWTDAVSVAEAQSPEHEGRTCTREMAQGGTRCFLRQTAGPRRREDAENVAKSGSKLAVLPRAHVLFVGGVEFHMECAGWRRGGRARMASHTPSVRPTWGRVSPASSAVQDTVAGMHLGKRWKG